MSLIYFKVFPVWPGNENMNGCKVPNPVTHSRCFINPTVPVLHVPFGVIDVGVSRHVGQ